MEKEKSKADKLLAIREAIRTSVIGSQEELLHTLSEQGIVVAQATLSRYLKQLKVVKAINEKGEYVYQMPDPPQASAETLRRHSGESFPYGKFFVSVEYSANIVVIHTRPGFASSLASEIDAHLHNTILGTVAGDDTIFAVKREDSTQQEVEEALSQLFPKLKK